MARKPSIFRADFVVTDDSDPRTVKVAVKDGLVNVGATGEINVATWEQLKTHVDGMLEKVVA